MLNYLHTYTHLSVVRTKRNYHRWDLISLNFTPANLLLIINSSYSHQHTLYIEKKPQTNHEATQNYSKTCLKKPSDEEIFSTENHISVRGKKALGNNQGWPSWSKHTPTTAASAHTQRIPKSGQQCDTGLHHHLIPLSC